MRGARAAAALGGVALVAGTIAARRARGGSSTAAGRGVTVRILAGSTTLDRDSGSVRSVQSAEIELAQAALAELWTAGGLERLGSRYWRFLTHVTLGIIRVRESARGLSLVLLLGPLKLLSFAAPEYRIDDARAAVRWRIVRGALLSRRGRDGAGYLQIELTQSRLGGAGGVLLDAEIEVFGFYPAIASTLGARVYSATQSRVHVLLTNGFLRSLAVVEPGAAPFAPAPPA